MLSLVAAASLSVVYPAGAQDVSRMCLTRAVSHGHLSADACLAGAVDVASYGGHLYSDKAPGVSFLTLPAAELVAMLETETIELVPSDKVVIEFVVSERRRKVACTIVWKNQRGCGIQFQPFNKRDTQIVDDLMYFVQNNREFRKSLLDDIFKQAA